MEEEIQELSLVLLYLTSWKEDDGFGDLHRSWKGYPFEVLDKLADEALIQNRKKSKSIYLT